MITTVQVRVRRFRFKLGLPPGHAPIGTVPIDTLLGDTAAGLGMGDTIEWVPQSADPTSLFGLLSAV